MTGLDRPFSRIWLSNSKIRSASCRSAGSLSKPISATDRNWSASTPANPNNIVADIVDTGLIPQLRDYTAVRREVKYGTNSRVDFLLESAGRPPCYLEIKNVHLMRKPGLAEFPDCVTERGAKHLDELAVVAAGGARAVQLYVIQIPSADRFAVARDIDPAYAAAFDRARAGGVEMLAWRCAVTVDGIELAAPVPIVAASANGRQAADCLRCAPLMLTLRLQQAKVSGLLQ